MSSRAEMKNLYFIVKEQMLHRPGMTQIVNEVMYKAALTLISFCLPCAGTLLYGQSAAEQLPAGKVYKVVQQDESYSFDYGEYAVFIPDGEGPLRGVFIHQHGCTMEGRGAATAYDLQYQAFASKWRLAVVGPDLYAAEGNCHKWKDPGSGSGSALQRALDEAGFLSGHPELGELPWLLWGHSGGGYWAQAMLREHPERVIALFSYSPGLDPDFDYPEAALKVPVMIRYAGEEGDECCWKTAEETYERLRNPGGYASIALTPRQNHNYSFVRYMAIPFYESVLAQRLPDRQSGRLRDMDPSRAWLGDPETLNLYQASGYAGDPQAMCWLPDSLVAAKWREYIITGTVADHTPPFAPADVIAVSRHNRNVELTWKAAADIESGIKCFHIYQDGRLVARFPSSGDYQWFDTNGDDAYPVTTLPEMRTELKDIIPEGVFSVTTVNHFGLESPRTDAVVTSAKQGRPGIR